MSKEDIHAVVVPKWGLTMEEGLISAWHVTEGSAVALGDELLEIETSKITNDVEATQAGILRRQVGKEGETYPCGALIGVIAEAAVPEEEITAFVAEHARPAREQRPVALGPVPQMLEVQGRALRYFTLGTGGAPILLIHGFAGDLNNWLLVQPALSAERATYAIDLPGHGGSSKDLSGINSFEDVADLLFSYLDALKVERVHIVAHSMGAPIALAMARRATTRVESLSLLAPAALGSVVNPEFVDGLVTAKTRRQVADVLKLLFVNEKLVSRELAEDMLRFKRLDGVEAALIKFAGFLSNDRRSFQEALEGISQPVAVVWGADDKVTSPITMEKLLERVDLTLLKNTGHMPHTEQSAATAEAIRKLIERAK